MPLASAAKKRGSSSGSTVEVGIEDHEHVAGRRGEPLPHRIALADPGALADERHGALGMERDLVLDLLGRAVARVALDEDDLGAGAHLRGAAHRLRNVSRSFRAGMTTLTRHAAAPAGDSSGRAITSWIRPSWVNGQKRPTM